MKRLLSGLSSVGLLLGCALAIPSELTAQRSGAEIWSQACGRCHLIQPTNRYTVERWEGIMVQMQMYANLTDDETEAILEFLKAGARRATAEAPRQPAVLARLASLDGHGLAVAEPNGAEVYQRQCVACHGKAGKGDGPAAAAMDPRPSDLTDAERMAALGDEGLLGVIAEGRGAMPGYKSLLTPEQLEAVTEYVRSMYAGDGK